MKKILIIFIFLLIAMGLFFLPEVQAAAWYGTVWDEAAVNASTEMLADEEIIVLIKQNGNENVWSQKFQNNGKSSNNKSTVTHEAKVNYILSTQSNIEMLFVTKQSGLKVGYGIGFEFVKGNGTSVGTINAHTRYNGCLVVAATLNAIDLEKGEKTAIINMIGDANKKMGLDFKIELTMDLYNKAVVSNQYFGESAINNPNYYDRDVKVVVGHGNVEIYNQIHTNSINKQETGYINKIEINIDNYTFAKGETISVWIGAKSNGLRQKSKITWGAYDNYGSKDSIDCGSFAKVYPNAGFSNILISVANFECANVGKLIYKFKFESERVPGYQDTHIDFEVWLTFNVGDFAQSHTPLDESNITRLAKFAEEKLGNGDTMLLIKSGNQYYYWIYGGIDAKDSTDTNRVILPVDASGFKLRAYQMCEIYIFFEKSYMVNDSAGIDRSRQWM